MWQKDYISSEIGILKRDRFDGLFFIFVIAITVMLCYTFIIKQKGDKNMKQCPMTMAKDYKACFNCTRPDCTCDIWKQPYEPGIDPLSAEINGKKYNINGKMLTISEISVLYNIKRTTLDSRLKKGKTIVQALKEPIHKRAQTTMEYNGKRYTYRSLAKTAGCAFSNVYAKMNDPHDPWTIEEILDPGKRKQRLAKA